MGYCFVPRCNHRGSTCSLYRFPKSPRRRSLWLRNCRRLDSGLKQYSRIGSCHFSPNKKEQPTRFPWSVTKRLQFCSPEKKKNNRCFQGERKHAHKSSPPQMDTSSSLSGVVHQPNQPAQLEESIAIVQPMQDNRGVHTAIAQEDPAERHSSGIQPVCENAEEGTVNAQQEPAEEHSVIQLNNTAERTGEDKTCVCDDCPEKRKNLDLQEALAVLRALFDSSKENWNKENEKLGKVLSHGDVMARAESYFLQQKVDELEKELTTARSKFSFSQIEMNDNLVSHYTGLPNKATFDLVVSLFDDLDIKYYDGWNVVCISRRDQIFLTLMKLRRNFSHLDLATRFGVSESTIANIVMTWIHAMHYVLVGADNSLLSNIPSRFKNQKHLPGCFLDYPNTRIIIDCTEVRTADPKLISKHNAMYSSYKHYVTGKGLIGISPEGTVTFASELYPGSTSDKDVVQHSKLLDKITRGDSIMADKGFLISSLLPSGVSINLPPFKETPQFTPEQIDQGYSVN